MKLLDGRTDVDRLENLYRAYARIILSYALRRVSREDAQEVLANTFLTAWRRLDDIPDEALPWLLSVARNLVANSRRSENRRSALLLKLKLAFGRQVRQDPTPTDLRENVLSAMAALSDHEREALMLVYWDDLGIATAAQVAGCSPGTLTTRLHRGRRHLASELAQVGVLRVVGRASDLDDQQVVRRQRP